MRARILGTGGYLPPKVLTNHDLEKIVDTSHDWIVARTGIEQRHVVEEETTSDLATRAAQQALQEAGLDPRELDLVIVATATPDMPFPSTACLVQDRLGARRAFAFDLSAVCTGFIYALAVADQFIRTGSARYAVVIGAEVFSKIIDWTDRATCVLFGDGAGAVVIGPSEDPERGILSTHLHADGAMWDLICLPGGGSRFPPSESTIQGRLHYVKMKGNETFKVAVRTLEEAAVEALKANGKTAADLDLLVPHQANLRILRAIAERLGVEMERVMINVQRVGNTSAASVPLALDEAVRTARVQPGDLVLLAAFGAGLTWGSALLRW